jgi:hypothetical protein
MLYVIAERSPDLIVSFRFSSRTPVMELLRGHRGPVECIRQGCEALSRAEDESLGERRKQRDRRPMHGRLR